MKAALKTMLSSVKKSDLYWRYGSNLSNTIEYRRKSKDLSEVENKIVSSLMRDGIAITSAVDLLGSSTEIDDLERETRKQLDERSDEISELRSKAVCDTEVGSKTFNLELLGSVLTFDPASIFARFALNHSMINIANAYFRMRARLRYYNVWLTFASHSDARESQLWHFDREDNRILKMFLYLDDVDENTGPFTYAPGTQRGGEYSSVAPDYFLEGPVKRSTDEQMNAVFQRDGWVRGTGPRGTLILADTRGYHKGGEARSRDRLMYTAMYTSPASGSRRLIEFPKDINESVLSEKQLGAIRS